MATTKITSPELFDLASLDTALKLPSGTTAQRPTSPSTGEWRYNTTTNLVEFWDGGAWRDLQSEDIPPIPSEHFNTVIYTGDGSATRAITGVGFEPDMVWVKARNNPYSHNLQDSSRGGGSSTALNPNLTLAAGTYGIYGFVSSFDTDGFTVGTGSSNNVHVNASGTTYVAWCWKANGGTTSSNTDGTITSTVQANTKAGFSVVSYTGNAVSGATIGHGLGVEPDIVIVKNLNLSTQSWNTYVKNVTTTNAQFLTLNTNNANGNTANPRFIPGNFSSSVFSVGNDNSTNGVNGVDTYISYCFASVAGYSKIGSYTGNGSASGPIVNTGFEVGWILIKNTTSVGESWIMFDNARNTSNPRNCQLRADTDVAEACTVDTINFYANGFQPLSNWGGYNASGDTYIYMAFAADASAAPTLPDSFNTSLYTGNGSTKSITGVGFQPDFIWIKNRVRGNNHVWSDSIRGFNQMISSDRTDAESLFFGTGQQIQNLSSDGFEVYTPNSGYGEINYTGDNFVAWNWKANSIPTINTDGSSQSIVSANQAAGFSIVKWNGTGSAATVGHGLSAAPEIILTKKLNGIGDWYSFSAFANGGTTPANYFLKLNSTAAETLNTGSPPSVFAGTVPTATVFSVGSTLSASSSDSYIAYCFTSISGFSKMGSYAGNGTSQTVNLGFEPAWVMLRKSDDVQDWFIFDSARDTSNPKTLYLEANTSDAEASITSNINFTSTGLEFTSASFNDSNKNFIYMAFKENPTPMPLAGNMSFLVVAGGGSGGAHDAGSAGAGGLRTSYGGSSGGGSSAESDITLAAGTYTITVGAGGSAIVNPGGPTPGNAGTGSVLNSITSIGGGEGGTNAAVAGNGGSGGGGTGSYAAGSGTTGQGFQGGAGTPNWTSGGGGGAGAVGSAPSANEAGGNGGSGLAVSITGSSVTYAGGGGGAGATTLGQGGQGGGGAGGNGSNTPAGSGQANTGGGGGAQRNGGSTASGAGGSGVVILRLLTSEYSGSTTGSPTVTTDGDYSVLTYTGSGTYVHS